MSIVMNGTTIPTKKGNIKFNGTEITEVICNGTSVWKVVTDPIYIIKAGEVQTGYTNPTCYHNGHTGRTGYILLGSGVYVYGLYAHTVGSANCWYVVTDDVQTEGASTIEVELRLLVSGNGVNKTVTVNIYSGDTIIGTQIFTGTNYEDVFTYTCDISGYSSISIELKSATIGNSTNAWVGFGIVNAVLK